MFAQKPKFQIDAKLKCWDTEGLTVNCYFYYPPQPTKLLARYTAVLNSFKALLTF